MDDVGEAAELALEPIEVRARRLAQHLERDLGAALSIVREIHHAEVARGELATDLEAIGPCPALRCVFGLHNGMCSLYPPTSTLIAIIPDSVRWPDVTKAGHVDGDASRDVGKASNPTQTQTLHVVERSRPVLHARRVPAARRSRRELPRLRALCDVLPAPGRRADRARRRSFCRSSMNAPAGERAAARLRACS